MSTSLAVSEVLVGTTEVLQRHRDGSISFRSSKAGDLRKILKNRDDASDLYEALRLVQGLASLALTGTQTVAIAGTRQYTSTATYTGGATRDVSASTVNGGGGLWSSSNTALATVDQNGLITGIASGTPTITHMYAGQTATRTVTVS